MEYIILHRDGYTYSGGYIPDANYAFTPCATCEEALGFAVPIMEDDGRPAAHLSCQIAAAIPV